jgi:hypothetical protein
MFSNNFVVVEDKFLQPSYRISPFRTQDVSGNRNLPKCSSIDTFLAERFGDDCFTYTRSGRAALNKALSFLDLRPNDVVTILTTSGNYYISGCVTSEIEKYCGWSRQFEKNTKVILVNHEFGFPYEGLLGLKGYGLPIIEDCAHSFFSQNSDNSVGAVGDYVVYSLPKFFPLQFGGLLRTSRFHTGEELLEAELAYIKAVLSSHVESIEQIKLKRVSNWKYLEEKLSKMGFEARFRLEPYHCPGVYMFTAPGVDLNGLKAFMQYHGVECSVFYGEESFFIPVHQNLDLGDLDYICLLIEVFLQGEGK